MSPVTGNLQRAASFGMAAVSIAIDAMFVVSAHQATMISAAASTLSSADRGEGAKTGDSKEEFMATNNFALSSVLPIDCGLVRTESFPYLGKCWLLSFKERLRGIFAKETQLCLAELAIFMSRPSFLNYATVEKMFETGVACRAGCIPSFNLNINL